MRRKKGNWYECENSKYQVTLRMKLIEMVEGQFTGDQN